ncbi:MAG: porin family protein [Sphingobacteriia bacterium]|nr:porin family protein [Sphingobacteriia bacterium]
MLDNNQLDQKFKDALSNLEVDTPSHSWELISSRLSNETRPNSSTNKEKDKRFIFPVSFIRVAASIALLIGIRFLWQAYYTPTGMQSLFSESLSLRLLNRNTLTEAKPKVKELPKSRSEILPKAEIQSELLLPALAINNPTSNIENPKELNDPKNLSEQKLTDTEKTVTRIPDIRMEFKNAGIAQQQDPNSRFSKTNTHQSVSPGSTSGRWQVSSLISPDLNYGSNRSIDQALAASSSRVDYSAGLRLGYQVNSRLQIQSGVQYADRGTMLIPKGEQDNYHGGTQFIRAGAPQPVRAQLIDIPVMVRYRLLGQRLRWYMSTGINANLSGGTSSLALGTGTEYRFLTQFSFSVEPTYRRLLLRTQALQPNSVGILTGLNYRF